MTAAVIYPHQLFGDHPALKGADCVFLIEDPLLFGNDAKWPCRMHLQKLVMHRASMRRYAEQQKLPCEILKASDYSTTEKALEQVVTKASCLQFADVVDDLLGRRIHAFLEKKKVPFKWFDSPAFLTPSEWGAGFFKGGKALMGNFYKAQRNVSVCSWRGMSPWGESGVLMRIIGRNYRSR